MCATILLLLGNGLVQRIQGQDQDRTWNKKQIKREPRNFSKVEKEMQSLGKSRESDTEREAYGKRRY